MSAYDSLNDWNDRMNAAEIAARPFYLMGQDTLRLPDTPGFASEDEAYAWVEKYLGADAWNNTAVLCKAGDDGPSEPCERCGELLSADSIGGGRCMECGGMVCSS